MEHSFGIGEEKEGRPFSGMSDSAKHWQQTYASAVVVAQMMQRNGLDPYEAQYLRPDEIHMIFMSCKIYTFEEQAIFDIAVLLLKERHNWSYGN